MTSGFNLHPRWIAALVLPLALLTGCHASQDYTAINKDMKPGTGFVRHETSFGPRERVYTVFVPNDYTPEKKYPTILFLHGWLQGGTGGVSALDSGIGPYVIRHKHDFPFLVIFPQSSNGKWDDLKDQDDAIRVLDKVEKEYTVDVNRVTLMGISYGGTGAYRIGAKYRNWFSSIVPMCGNADPKTAARIAPLPIWIFHYSTDPFVWKLNSEQMTAAIKAAGGDPKFTRVPGFGHYVWEDAVGEELLTWMSSQSREQWVRNLPASPKKDADLSSAGN